MKKFSKILAMVMVALMMMSVVAFAEEAVKPGDPVPTVGDDAFVTVVLSGLTKGEEATILVVNDIRIVETEETDDNGEKVKIEETVELASLENTDIVYIDQLTVEDDGTVTFELDASKAVANGDGEQYVNIYCGYTSMDVTEGPLTCEDLLVNPSEEPETIYGDVDGDGYVNGADLTAIINAMLAGDTVAVKPNCDVDKDTYINGADLTAVINTMLAS